MDFIRREHYYVGRHDDVDQEYVQHDKKNVGKKLIDKMVPIVIFGTIIILWILVMKR